MLVRLRWITLALALGVELWEMTDSLVSA
jgi:hypothetical protein